MSELTIALGMAAPWYNMGLVLIVLYLFYVMFTTPIKNKKVYLTPWKIIFWAVMIFVAEEVITILRQAQVVNIPVYINGYFELIIISLFIFMLLKQKQHMK